MMVITTTTMMIMLVMVMMVKLDFPFSFSLHRCRKNQAALYQGLSARTLSRLIVTGDNFFFIGKTHHHREISDFNVCLAKSANTRFTCPN